ncbi:AraC family transcriptional regulator [Aeoliella mucimassa]|uniref:Xylose operon regulatory protein n=1 Tax=Aeoliella mucimassa TaxID=2527972 RepID=A0A518AR77_9BACT|nr:DNA-binding transcriptional regulator [Aeoliella mucimassa]QDU57231.1 Xylose operon regulatory protein [Aeoliella mucimassa]
MERQAPFRVAVLVDTSSAWGRRLNQGILLYAERNGPWNIWVEPRGGSETLRIPEGWSGHGIIARVSSPAMARHLQQQNLPVVNVSGIRVREATFPKVSIDNDAFAQLAVEHFLDRGVRHIAYVGLHARPYSVDRQEALARACEAAGCDFLVYHQVPDQSGRRWLRARERLGSWIEGLPKPVGILAWAVRRGGDVIEEAMHRGFRVPDDVAVLGDDDELLCNSVHPPLSGVVLPSEQIGLKAAAMIHALMEGRPLDERVITVAPTAIEPRASTDVLAIDDTEVASAVRIIRNRASNPLSVQEIADTLAISRRSLERRFQQSLHRTMGDEISRVHLERAKLLLATTDMPIPAVADASGYGSPEYFARVMKRDTGLTPRQYRGQHQGR